MILLYHEHRRLYIWNAIVMIGASFMAFYTTLNISMGALFDIQYSSYLSILYWLSSTILIIDAFVRYDRFKNEKNNSGQRKSTFWSGWILFDLVSAFPFALIFGTGFFQLLRLLKLVRVSRFISQFKQVEVKYSISLTLISFFFWAILLIHILSCGWASFYGVDSNANFATNYISALYWTVTTLTSTGYGDILPVTNIQRLYSVLVQITGIGLFGYLIGNVVTILSKLNVNDARYQKQVDHLSTAARQRGLSKELQRRILEYYSHLRDDTTGYDESAFLATLPETLKTEVALNLKKEFIEGIPLFKNASDRFIVDVALQLESSMTTPGDYIFKEGDPANDMYFIISGELEVLNKEENQILAKLKSGDFFGEIALVENIPRTATVKATDYCHLYRLKRKIFKTILRDHPEIAAQIEQEAKQREQRYLGE